MRTNDDIPPPPLPSFLMTKVRSAKERARGISQRETLSAPSAAAALSPKATEASLAVAELSGSAKERRALAEQALAPVVPGDIRGAEDGAALDAEAVEALFRTHTRDPAAFELARPHLAGVMQAILDGACVRGPQGHQDRMTLFRILGVPWTPTNTPKQEGAREGEGFENRLVRSLSRAAAAVGGRASVTVTASFDADAADPATIDGVAHKMDGHATWHGVGDEAATRG